MTEEGGGGSEIVLYLTSIMDAPETFFLSQALQACSSFRHNEVVNFSLILSTALECVNIAYLYKLLQTGLIICKAQLTHPLSKFVFGCSQDKNCVVQSTEIKELISFMI